MNKNIYNFFVKYKLIKIIPDKWFIKICFKHKLGYKLNLKNPQTFNEKMQWLKLYDRKPEYTKMVDKYEVKKYVASILGEEYIIPTLGIYNSFDEIDFSKLPNQFVIKCTHDSDGIVICKDKNKFNIIEAKEKIEKSLKKNYYYCFREWPYKNVKPRIIIEKYMQNEKQESLYDYKFFCFNGITQIMYISNNSHQKNQQIAFFDMNFNNLPVKRKDYKSFNKLPTCPQNFELMKNFSEQLSKNIPHVRVDWYEINQKLYFGEFTFSTCAGFIPFEDKKWDYKFGEYINLEEIKKKINKRVKK